MIPIMYKRRRTMHGEEWNGDWQSERGAALFKWMVAGWGACYNGLYKRENNNVQSSTHQSFLFASFPLCLLLACSSDRLFCHYLFVFLCRIRCEKVLQSGLSSWTSLGVMYFKFCLAIGSSDRKVRWFIHDLFSFRELDLTWIMLLMRSESC